MSRKIETILEVIAEIRELRSTTMQDSPFAEIRRQAVRTVATRHKRAIATIQNNWLRGLKPEISGTAEFDTLVEAYLSGVSNHIREVLLQFARDKSDRHKIDKLLPEFDESAKPANGMHLSTNSALSPRNGSAEHQAGEQPEVARVHRKPKPAPRAGDLRIRERDIRKSCTTYRVLRETAEALRVRRLHSDHCQICGDTLVFPDGTSYAETHHLQPLGSPYNGPDIAANILCLCPKHHAMIDLGMLSITPDQLRTHEEHSVGQQYIDFHNTRFCRHESSVLAADEEGGPELLQ